MKNTNPTFVKTFKAFVAALVLVAAANYNLAAQTPIPPADEAIAAVTAKIAAAPTDGKLYVERGMIYLKTRKLAEALADAEKAVALDPKNPHALNLRGNAKSIKKDFDGALGDYSTVIEMYPDKALPAYFWRGEIYEIKDQWTKALADYSKALEIEPKFQPAATARERLENKIKAAGAVAVAPQSEGDRVMAQMQQALGYYQKLDALQKLSQPAVAKLKATMERNANKVKIEYAEIAADMADARRKLLAEVELIDSALPVIRKINLPPVQKMIQTFENTLRTDNSFLSNNSEFKIAHYRIRGAQQDFLVESAALLSEETNALIAANDAKDKTEKAKWLTKEKEAEAKRIALTRRTRDTIARGIAELEKFDDPAWQNLKPELQKDIAGYDKDITEYEKKKQ